MVKREKSGISLLFFIALVPCLCLSQSSVPVTSVYDASITSNKGVVSVKANTILCTVYPLENNLGAELINDGELYVYDDFKNDGKVGFSPGLSSGITRFYGQKSGDQLISGSETADVYNVQFNNGLSGFKMSNGLNVFGKADFQNGIINYEASNTGMWWQRLLSFEKDATAENADDASYVVGGVIKKGNSAFSYPIGGGGKYRPASISAPNELGAAFVSKYVFDNPNTVDPLAATLDPSLSLIDNAEYWVILRTDPGTSNVFVTLKWDEATTPSAIFADPVDDIHVVRWDNVKKLWVDEGGVVDFSKKEVVTVSQSLGTYGVFTLARVAPIVAPENIDLVHPGISPNSDGLNDELVIQGLETHPDNRVTVFDRFGKVIFDTTSYNTKGNVFKGYINENNTTILPLGTYFYTVDYLNESTGLRVKKSNYLYINLR
jgi:gliding motility-associated-like protein